MPDPCPWCHRHTLVADLTAGVITCGRDPDTGEHETCLCSDSYCTCKTSPRRHRHTWHGDQPGHKSTSWHSLARPSTAPRRRLDDPDNAAEYRARMPGQDEKPSRDHDADERDRIADERDGLADRREFLANRREQTADGREESLDDLADDLRGQARRLSVPIASEGEHQRRSIDRTEDQLERSYQEIDRRRAKLSRDEATDSRGQDDVDPYEAGSETDTAADGN